MGRDIVTPEYTGPDRRDSGPWWSALLLNAEKIGYAGIAGFLIYIGAVVLRGDVSEIRAGLALHTVASEKVEKTMNSLVNVTVQQCVNAATTPAKRDACFVALTFAPVRDPR